MQKISNFMVGNKKRSFTNLLIGSNRLKDTDKDGVPDIFDCKPYNSKKDSPIIPQELQAPIRPLTLGEINQQNIKNQTIEIKVPEITNVQDTKQSEEYNKKLADYEAQKKAYDEAVNNYNKEIEAEKLGFRLWSKAQNGKNPYISEQDPLVQKYFYYYQNRQEAQRVKDLLNKANTVQEYKVIYESLGQDLKKYAPVPAIVERMNPVSTIPIPSGYQGVTTREGIILQKIPEKQKSLPQIFIPTEINLGLPKQVQQTRGTTLNMQPPAPSMNINLSNLTLEQAKQQMNMEVKPVTGIEKLENTIYSNPLYQKYQQGASTLAQVPLGFGLLAGSVIEPFFSFGRNEKDTSTSAKVERGLLMAGKTALVESNPITAFATGTYFIGSAGSKLIENPVGFGLGTIKYIASEPFEFAGGLIGGATSGAIRGLKTKSKITESIKEGEFVAQNIKGLVNEKEVVKLNIDEAGKQEILGYIKKGNTVRTYNMNLKPKPGLESSTPKIEGQFYEVIDQYGNVVIRRTIGKVKAEYKGKKVQSESIGVALLKLDETTGKIEGVSDVIERQKNKMTISRFLESSELKRYEQANKRRLLESETTTSILSREKYKDQSLLEPYGINQAGTEKALVTPEYSELMKSSKPVSKSRTIEYSTLNKEIKPSGALEVNPLTGEATGSLTQIQTFKSYGVSKSKVINVIDRNIKLFHGTVESSEKSILKEGFKNKENYFTKDKGFAEGFAGRKSAEKGFKEKPTVSTINLPESVYKEKLIKRQVGKGGSEEVVLSEISPEYIQGGEVGKQVKSAYEKKTFNIPYGGEEVVFSAAKQLPKEVLRDSITRGFISGLKYIPSKQSEKFKISLIQPEINRSNSSNLNKNINLSSQSQNLNTSLVNLNSNNQIQKPESLTKTLQIPIQKIEQQTRQKLKQEPSINRPISITPPVPPIFTFTGEEPLFFNKGKEESGTKEGYIPEALINSTKSNKAYWKKLSNQPMTKKSALSVAAEYVDKNISARGKVVKVKTNKQVIDTGEDYFGANNYKFRTFQQKKGVRTNLPNSFIEKQRYRADKPSEQITLKTEKRNARRTPFGF